MGERQIKVDCDVIQADGGTRTAAITGGYVALHLAFQHLVKIGKLKAGAADRLGGGDFLRHLPGRGGARPRLCRGFDSAEADTNFVLTGSGGIVEDPGHRRRGAVQPGAVPGTAEPGAARASRELTALQKAALGFDGTGHR